MAASIGPFRGVIRNDSFTSSSTAFLPTRISPDSPGRWNETLSPSQVHSRSKRW